MNNFSFWKNPDAETPEDKAKRLNVPIIPAKPYQPKPTPNPVIAICGECGLEIKQVMGYSCQKSNCPVFRQVTL